MLTPLTSTDPWPQVSDKFSFGLFDLDWDVFMQHIEGAINRVPVLETTGIKSTVCGPGGQGDLVSLGALGPPYTLHLPSVLSCNPTTPTSLSNPLEPGAERKGSPKSRPQMQKQIEGFLEEAA